MSIIQFHNVSHVNEAKYLFIFTLLWQIIAVLHTYTKHMLSGSRVFSLFWRKAFSACFVLKSSCQKEIIFDIARVRLIRRRNDLCFILHNRLALPSVATCFFLRYFTLKANEGAVFYFCDWCRPGSWLVYLFCFVYVHWNRNNRTLDIESRIWPHVLSCIDVGKMVNKYAKTRFLSDCKHFRNNMTILR